MSSLRLIRCNNSDDDYFEEYKLVLACERMDPTESANEFTQNGNLICAVANNPPCQTNLDQSISEPDEHQQQNIDIH